MSGLILAIIVGIFLGLLGGGGSILTVPILIYAVGIEAKLAIALSLGVVAVTSLFGVIGHSRSKNIDLKIAATFGAFAMSGTFVGTKISQFLSAEIQLVLFSIIMLLASFFMFKGRGSHEVTMKDLNVIAIGAQGVVVGIITGLVGVGGGFLIVPALNLFAGLSMKKAVGTSLLIISANSFTGFFGYLSLVDIPWSFFAKFTTFSILGIFIGTYFANRVPQETLKKIFSIFLVIMGGYILFFG